MRSSHLLLLPILFAASGASANSTKSLTVTSNAFKANETIPTEYTCEGANKAPPLSWSNVPADAKSVAILVDDPDAPKGVFTHWIKTNIPPSQTALRLN